jgi:hypothetical protein
MPWNFRTTCSLDGSDDERSDYRAVDRVEEADGRTHAGREVQMNFIATVGAQTQITLAPGRLTDDPFRFVPIS